MKRHLSILLCILFLLPLLSAKAGAADTSNDNLTEFSNQTSAIVSKYGGGKYIDDTVLSYVSDINVNFPSGVVSAEDAKRISSIDPKNYLVSADILAEAADGSTKYDESRGQLTIRAGGGSVQLAVPGKRVYSVHGSGPIYGPIYSGGHAEVPLLDTAEKLGFNVVQTDSGMLLSYTYQTARLIVRATEKPDTEGAIDIEGGYKGYYLLQYSTVEAAVSAQKLLSAQSCVTFAEADGIMHLQDTGVSDYSYLSWGPHAIGADSFNDGLLANFGSVGAMPEVRVAVLDSGVDTDSSFLSGRLINLSDGNDYNLVDDYSNLPEDDNGHGTHVSGIIADATLPNIKIMPIKIGYANGTVNTSVAVVAIEEAVSLGAKVINMSFGGVGDYQALEDAIDDAYSKGVLSVVSAGNDSADVSNYSPADTPCALTVAALANKNSSGNYSIAYYSNHGSSIDLAAPGSGIISTWLNNTLRSSDGTSMAAPFVSAAAASVYTMEYDGTRGVGPTPYQLTRMLCSSAADFGSPGWDEYYGYGMLNLNFIDMGTWQARIGSTHFASLSDAVSAASDGDTIELPWNLSLTSTVEIDKSISIHSDKKLTLDRASDFTGALFDIRSGGSLTLGGGDAPLALSGDGQNGDSLVIVENGGALILSQGTVLENNVCSSTGGAIRNSGSVTVCGGTITGTSATVSGGDIYDDGALIFSGNAALGISGDVYLCSGRYIDVTQALSGGSIVAALTLQVSGEGITAVRFAAGLTPDRSRFKLSSDGLDLTVSGQVLVTALASDSQASIGDVKYTTLMQAFASAIDGDTINLIRNTNLTTGIVVNKTVTLSSPGGYVLSRDSSFKGDLLTVSPGVTLTLGMSGSTDSLVLDGGSFETSGHIVEVSAAEVSGGNSCGALIINSGVTVRNFLGITPKTTVLTSYGGAVDNNGSVTINGGSFTSSSGKAAFGAALSNWSGSSMTINGGSFVGNIALYGGAVYNAGNMTIAGGLFDSNEANGYKISTTYRSPNGGAIYNNSAGSMLITGGTFKTNICTGDSAVSSNSAGGCIYSSGSLTISGGLYYGNSGNCSYGGAIYNSGTLVLNGGVIQSNSSSLSGGGIYDTSSLLISGSVKVTDNTANSSADNIQLTAGKFLSVTGNFTGTAGVSTFGESVAGTKFAEAASNTFSGLENFLPDSGGAFLADYLSDDTVAPFDILWMTPIKHVELSGNLCGGDTLTAIINGAAAPKNGLSFIWYSGDDTDGWTVLPGENNSSLVLSHLEYAGKKIKVTVEGDRKTVTGTISAVSSDTIAPFACPPEATPAITADYQNGMLIGFVDGGSYSINGESAFTSNGTSLAIRSEWFGTTLLIVKKASGTDTSDSGTEELVLAPRPGVPTVRVSDIGVTAFTVTFPGTAGLEYSIDDGASWSSTNTFTGLTKSTPYSCKIRVGAKISAPASLPEELLVTTCDASTGAIFLYDTINLQTGDSAAVAGTVVMIMKNLTLSASFTVPENVTLSVPSGIDLTLPMGFTITNNSKIMLCGSLQVNDGATLVNNGTLDIEDTAQLENYGTVNNTLGASLIINGSLSGNGRLRERAFSIGQSSDKRALTISLTDLDDGFNAENGSLIIAQYDGKGRMTAVNLLPYDPNGDYSVPIFDNSVRASAFILALPSSSPVFASASCIITG